MKRIILYVVFVTVILVSNTVKASHFIGGEITWECRSNGKYVFYLRVFRECNGIMFGTIQTLNSNSPIGNIPMTIVTGYPKDISPVCNSDTSFSHITCSGATVSNTGAVSEFLYESSEVYLYGVPPAFGWEFYWGTCCRNSSTNISNATGSGWRLRVKMYPYNNTNAYPCMDNSPSFAEPPTFITYTSPNIISSFIAFDKDHDEIKYDWALPKNQNGNPLAYIAGYSFYSPLPNSLQNANNIPANLDTITGITSFTSYTTGTFLAAVKATSYRNGIKTAEVFREVNMTINTGSTNTAPSLNAAGYSTFSIIDTVFIGDTINIPINANDFQFLPNGGPQTVFITASGNQFGNYIPGTSGVQPSMSTTNGCLNPPCAIMAPALDFDHPLSGIYGNQSHFKWVVTSAHINPNSDNNIYNFIFTSRDDYCPVPAFKSLVLSFVVKDGLIYEQPNINYVTTLANGDVKISFDSVNNPNNTFVCYKVYSSIIKNGPYIMLDSITNSGLTEYINLGVGSDTIQRYYFIEMISQSLNGAQFVNTEFSDTVSNMCLRVEGVDSCQVKLRWNPVVDSLNQNNNSKYYIYKRVANSWQFLDTTYNTNYQEVISYNGDSVAYRILYSCCGASAINAMSNIAEAYIPSINNQYISSRAAEVIEPSGAVKVFWNRYRDLSGNFVHYNLFCSSGNSNVYSQIASISNVNLTSYVHTGAGANIQSNHYYVQSLGLKCDNTQILSYQLDTVSTILIDTMQQFGNDIAFSWNNLKKVPLATSSNKYYIFRKSTIGSWSVIDSTTQLTYTDLNVSSDTVYYKVSIFDYNADEIPILVTSYSNVISNIVQSVEGVDSSDFRLMQNTPNPFSNVSYISIFSRNSCELDIAVYSATGKLVRFDNLHVNKGKNTYLLERKGLMSGIYYLKVSDKKTSRVIKIVIQ